MWSLRLVVGAALVCAPTRALAERDVVVTTPGERSTTNLAVAAGLLGGGVLFGAAGVYFHLESRSQSDAVSADTFTGQIWTRGRDESYDDANRNKTLATGAYIIGGALTVSALVYYIATDPPDETVVIRTRTTPIIVPQQGGAFLGGAWRF